jgi:hypothetical protein
VAREGSHAPGTPGGTSFRELDRFTLNNAGQTALMADLAGNGVDMTNDSGIWSERSGALSLVVREGTQAPGLLEGITFKSFGNPALNDAGQIVFSATVAGIGVDETNNEGIWGTDRAGFLQLIAHKGQSLEVSPGEFRTIDEVYFDPGGFSGNSDGFNNLGQLAFWAGFTDDSSGIFVSNAVAIPEPKMILLLLCASAAAIGVRRNAL